jgi:DNA-binding CsgD family transcriptional regulator
MDELMWLRRAYGLTKREIEVARAVLGGKRSKTIAHEFGISEATVQVHRNHVNQKLDIHCTAGLFALVLAGAPKEGESAGQVQS